MPARIQFAVISFAAGVWLLQRQAAPILFNRVKGRPQVRALTNVFADINVVDKLFGFKGPVERIRLKDFFSEKDIADARSRMHGWSALLAKAGR